MYDGGGKGIWVKGLEMRCMYTVWSCSVDNQKHLMETLVDVRLTVVYRIRVMNEVHVNVSWRTIHQPTLSRESSSSFPKRLCWRNSEKRTRNSPAASVLPRGFCSSGYQTTKGSSKLDITPAEIPYHYNPFKIQRPTSPTPKPPCSHTHPPISPS